MPFKQGDERYFDENGCHVPFEKVIAIYNFDGELRSWIFSAVCKIEIFARSQIAYFLAHKYGQNCHYDKATFGKKHDHRRFLKNFAVEIENRKNEPFVKHHKEKYAGVFPIWSAVELFTFGALSKFFADLKNCDKVEIAKNCFDLADYKLIEANLHCCAVLRNFCAHNGRLYFRKFQQVPKISKASGISAQVRHKVFVQILAIKSLSQNFDGWSSRVSHIEKIVEKYAKFINFGSIGFPKNWKNLLEN